MRRERGVPGRFLLSLLIAAGAHAQGGSGDAAGAGSASLSSASSTSGLRSSLGSWSDYRSSASQMSWSDTRPSEMRGSETRASRESASELRLSETRASEMRGSDLRESEARWSDLRESAASVSYTASVPTVTFGGVTRPAEAAPAPANVDLVAWSATELEWGSQVERLPPIYQTLAFGGMTYYMFQDVFYLAMPDGEPGYFVAKPPVGARVSQLPPGTEPLLGGPGWFVLDDVYFQQVDGGYLVVDPPGSAGSQAVP